MQSKLGIRYNFKTGPSSVEKREADPLSDPQVVYGWNALAYPYGGGFYTPSLAYHDHGPYPYVAGYGPSAYTYGYRRFY